MPSKKNCPKCKAADGMRKILWGMPDGNVDESTFYIGGCLVEDSQPEYKCIKCNWEGLFREDLPFPHDFSA